MTKTSKKGLAAMRGLFLLALDHHDALMANWARGEALEPMELIPGADVDD